MLRNKLAEIRPPQPLNPSHGPRRSIQPTPEQHASAARRMLFGKCHTVLEMRFLCLMSLWTAFSFSGLPRRENTAQSTHHVPNAVNLFTGPASLLVQGRPPGLTRWTCVFMCTGVGLPTHAHTLPRAPPPPRTRTHSHRHTHSPINTLPRAHPPTDTHTLP